jgi:hypothetical protein
VEHDIADLSRAPLVGRRRVALDAELRGIGKAKRDAVALAVTLRVGGAAGEDVDKRLVEIDQRLLEAVVRHLAEKRKLLLEL